MSERTGVPGVPAPSRLSSAAAWIAAAGALLVVVNIAFELIDTNAQAEVNRRQAFITQTAAVDRIDNTLIRALAELAATRHDKEIAALLQRAGITYQLHPAAAATASPATASPDTASPAAAAAKP